MSAAAGGRGGPTRGRAPVFEYFPMTTIMDNLVNFIHGPITPINGQQPNAQLQSSQDRWLADNPLADGEEETEERARQYRAWLEDAIQDHVMQPPFLIHRNNNTPCPAAIAKRIAGRAFQFNVPRVSVHLNRYNNAITTDLKWMVVERAENMRVGQVRAPLTWRRLAHVIPCNYTPAQIHAIGVQRLRNKNNPTDIAYTFNINSDGRALLYVVLFHSINSLGILLANVLDMESCSGFESACQVLRRTRDTGGGPRAIGYPPPVCCELFFHKKVWPYLTEAIPNVAKQLVTDYLTSRPESELTFVKPTIGNPRPLLRPEHQIDWSTMLSAFLTPGQLSNIFTTPFLQCTFSALVDKKVLTAQQAYHDRPPPEFIEAISTFLSNTFQQVIRLHVNQLTPQAAAQLRRSISLVVQRGIQDFLPRRQGYTNVRPEPRRSTTHARPTTTAPQPSAPPNQGTTAAGSSAQHTEQQKGKQKGLQKKTNQPKKSNTRKGVQKPATRKGNGGTATKNTPNPEVIELSDDTPHPPSRTGPAQSEPPPPPVLTLPATSIAPTQAESERSADIDEIQPIVCSRPADQLPQSTTSKRKRDQVRQCVLCKGPWPDSMDWPPPTRKHKNGLIVTLEEEVEDKDAAVSERTRRKKQRVATSPSSSSAHEKQDSLDTIAPRDGVQPAERQRLATETFQMFLDRTADMDNWLNTLTTMIGDKRNQLAEEQQQREDREAAEEQERQTRQAQRQQRASEEQARKNAAREERRRQEQLAEQERIQKEVF